MKTETKLPLIFFIFFGSILRLYNFWFRSFNCDERFTLEVMQKPFFEMLSYVIFNENSPPLFYIVAKISYILSGSMDIAIRYPSILFGILTIPAMYYLGVVYRDEIVGLYCAGFTVVLFPLVYYSQFGRPYSMVYFLFVLFLIQFIRVRKSNSPELKDRVLLGVLAAIPIWTHLFVIIPIGLMLVSLFFTKDKLTALSISATAFLLSTPMIVLPFVVHDKLVGIVTLGMDVHTLFAFSTPEFFSLAFPVFTVLVLYGIYKNHDNILRELFIVSVITIGIACFLSSYIPITPRYYQEISFILVLISAYACTILTEKLPFKRRIAIACSVIIIIFAIQFIHYFSYYTVLRAIC